MCLEVPVMDRRALDEAQAHIRDIDAAGEFPLTVRRKLRESLVALLPGDGRAHTFVAVLGLACARRAWPVWRTAFPSESRPMDLAETAVLSVREEGTPAAWGGSELMKVRRTWTANFFLAKSIPR